jgi:putative endonuclease
MISAIGAMLGGMLDWLTGVAGPRGGRRELGLYGERMAARHLRRRGYRIAARNFRAAGAEIDLVAIDGSTVVFVEVKARRSHRAGFAAEAVDSRKQGRIRRAAALYMARQPPGRSARFDVVTIDWEGGRPRLEHLKDVF